MSKERNSHFQFTRDVLFNTDKNLKKHIKPSPPVVVRRAVKREPNVPLWESEWREGEEAMRQANKRLATLLEKNKEAAPEQDHTE